MRAMENLTEELKKRVDAVELSLEILAKYQEDRGLGQKLDHLLSRVEQLDLQYHELQAQWDGIHLLIRDCARVSFDSLLTSVDAFAVISEGVTPFEKKRTLLDEATTEATKLIANRHFEGAKAITASAKAICEKLEEFIVYLGQCVSEHQTAENRGTVPSAATTASGSHCTVSIHVADTGPQAGRHSRFNMIVEYYLRQHSSDTPKLPGLGRVPELMPQRSYSGVAPSAKPPKCVSSSGATSSNAITSEPASSAKEAPGTIRRRRRRLRASFQYPQAVSPQTKAEMKRLSSYEPAGNNAEETDESKVDSAVSSELSTAADPLKSRQSNKAW